MANKGLVDMRLAGWKELAANLRELPQATAKNVVDRALVKVAQPMHSDAVQRARNATRGTGRNASKIVVTKHLSRRQKRTARKIPGDRTVYIGVRPSPIAHLIELGSGPRRTKKGANRGQMPARPFMRPAFDTNWRPALDNLGRILGHEIEKAAARLARKRRPK